MTTSPLNEVRAFVSRKHRAAIAAWLRSEISDCRLADKLIGQLMSVNTKAVVAKSGPPSRWPATTGQGDVA